MNGRASVRQIGAVRLFSVQSLSSCPCTVIAQSERELHTAHVLEPERKCARAAIERARLLFESLTTRKLRAHGRTGEESQGPGLTYMCINGAVNHDALGDCDCVWCICHVTTLDAGRWNIMIKRCTTVRVSRWSQVRSYCTSA